VSDNADSDREKCRNDSLISARRVIDSLNSRISVLESEVKLLKAENETLWANQLKLGEVRTIKARCYCGGKGSDDPKHTCQICENTGQRLIEVKE